MELSHSVAAAFGKMTVDKTMSEPLAKVKEQAEGESTAMRSTPVASSLPPAPEQERGNWFHRNRWFTKEPITYTLYQFFRSAIATIPYGFGMAAIHHLFGLLRAKGEREGLVDPSKGIVALENLQGEHSAAKAELIKAKGTPGTSAADLAKLTRTESELAGKLTGAMKPGGKAQFWRNMARVGGSPLNQALQIGLAFSMFRFTGGLIKAVRDKVMDEKNTPEDTKRETKNWWQTVTEAMKVNWKAEAVGTFWAALTLGFIGGLVKHTTPYQKLAGERIFGKGGTLSRIWGPGSKLLQNAAIWAISYSTFFEVDERIHKDVKIREGTWKGHHNSLNNGKGNPAIVGAAEKPGSHEHKADKDDHRPGRFFTDDPGLPRLIFRRILPVAVGIAGYAVMKRAGYVAAGGTMKPITQEVAKSGFGGNMKHFLNNSYREGLATATFGVLWAATDAWGSWYDKFFDGMQKRDSHKPMNEHQSDKHTELLDKLNRQEKGAAR